MTAASTDIATLALLAFVLGARHGLDADHLAAVDGLTRYNAADRPRLARSSGLLFSLGHGTVVVAVALGLSLFATRWAMPSWLESSGAWVSIVSLTVLGLLNLQSVLGAPPDEMPTLLGLKSRWFHSPKIQKAPMVALLGALFALSFDTLSQAALFACAGPQLGSWHLALGLALLFLLGMLVTDGLNGLFIFRLLARADRRARIAACTMGLTVAALSLGVAALGAIRLVVPAIAQWSDANGLILAASLTAAVILTCMLATRRPGLSDAPVAEGE